ncbi:uncharacterized protein LOC131302908 [Rhododendron vialii]|uniref:uncharacterized protein LOC131302908 n=1 Tax=Rhododendron vialii TaxID=182163 RepID=UPI00265E48AC|nr:uncharacterized protein LOC131302908 [Rhododendron vialii]
MATHKANAPPPNPNSLAIQIRKIIDEEHIAITNDVLVIANVDRVGLGPAFQLGFPSQLAPMYPLAQEVLPFESPSLDWNRFNSDIPNRLWHRPDAKYVEWLDRMLEAKGDLWKQIGIRDAILLSRSLIDMDKNLFLAASQFWLVTTNSFHFKVGLMSPILQDLAFLTGLHPHGTEANYFLSQKTPYFEYKEPLSLAPFINHYAKKGPVENNEHVAFLLYWLNKFIFCVSANRVTKNFIDLACALASGQKLALGPLVLAHLYRGMKELISNKFIFAPGPLWVMTLWLWSYFPKLAPPMNKKSEHTCYGFHYTDAHGPKYAFGTYFKFFYHELTGMGKNWLPFVRDTVPWWLKQEASNLGDDFDDHFEIWSSFLISRDLMYGMAYTPTNYKCGVEYYNAAQFARQFGLCRLTPLPPYQSLNEDFTDRLVV